MTQYYVDLDAVSSGDGLSDATAWNHPNDVNGATFASGDEVYFKCGTSFTLGSNGARLRPALSGTAGTHAKFGAYYMSGGSETIGVSGNKPRIDGNYDGTSDLGGPTSTGTYPDIDGSALVSFTNSTGYVDMENLDLRFSGQRGVSHDANNISVQNCNIQDCWRQGSVIEHVDNCTFSGNTVDNVQNYQKNGGNGEATGVSDALDATVQNNTIKNSGGEGVGIWKTQSGNTLTKVSGNRVHHCKEMIYLSVTNHVDIWNNFVTDNDGTGRGIALLNEASGEGAGRVGNADINVWNNLIAYTSKGMQIGCESASTDANGYKRPSNINFYHNTVVDSVQSEIHINNNLLSSTNINIKNNIFQAYTAPTVGISEGNEGLTGITWDYNMWSSTPGTGAGGANDPTPADALLSKNSGWQSISLISDVTSSDFELQSGSPAINAGTYLASYATDYNSNTRKSGATDIGAMEFTTGVSLIMSLIRQQMEA